MSLPLLLRAIRQRRGLTQQQLADELGLSRSSVSNAEAGRQDLPSSRLLALLEHDGLLVSTTNPNAAIAALASQVEALTTLLRAAEADVALYRDAIAAIRQVTAKAEAMSAPTAPIQTVD